MDPAKIRSYVDQIWDESIISALQDYIRIPNQSPDFDPDWKAAGHMDRAADLLEKWARAQEIPGLTLERVEHEGRTPLLYMEIPGSGDDTVLLYGHFDKQPPMLPWDKGLGPWEPVLRDGKLYGRGGADDGYAIFSSLAALGALAKEGIPHARCVVLIESCEESGSYDLPHYIDALKDKIGSPSLVVCLDSGCANYEQLWSTTSLRGMTSGTLKVQILNEGVHSGEATGVVASSFRIVRQLLSRIEDENTGEILLPELQADVPEQRMGQVNAMATAMGDAIWDHYPYTGDAQPVSRDPADCILGRTWKPTLAVTGVEGMPAVENAGNVLRPYTSVKLSMRLPPTCDPARATKAVKAALEKDPPYGATVTFDTDVHAAGWNAPSLAPWLEQATARASEMFFGKPACYMGEGGTIPLMGMLGEKFPEAQFLITGVLGPASNAHGPNEFLHIDMGKCLTACVASVLADHLKR